MLRWRLVWNVVWNIFPIVGATRKNSSSSFLAELFMHESDNEVWKVKKSIVGNPLNRKALWSLGKIWPCIHSKNYFFRGCRKIDRFRFESFETMKCTVGEIFKKKYQKFERNKIFNFFFNFGFPSIFFSNFIFCNTNASFLSTVMQRQFSKLINRLVA